MPTTLSNGVFAIGSLTVTSIMLRTLYQHLLPAATTSSGASGLDDGTVLGSFIHLLLAGATFMSLLFTDAPFGKLKQPGQAGSKSLSLAQRLIGNGFQVNGRIAWMLQECPTLVAVVVHAVIAAKHGLPPLQASSIPLVLFVTHYVQRSFVYPFAIMRSSNTVPLGISLLANLYCCFNGRLQSGLFFGKPVDFVDETANRAILAVGVALFALGMGANVYHDWLLAGLRKSGATTGSGYAIPHGGWFRVLSAPNLVGEMIEWTGYAIACFAVRGTVGFLVGGAFALYVYANLAPRALSAHRWYLQRFPKEYPRLNRFALIPGVL
jgi:3-oxo-5-alpha-steroid 4-dehydrogenase 1